MKGISEYSRKGKQEGIGRVVRGREEIVVDHGRKEEEGKIE